MTNEIDEALDALDYLTQLAKSEVDLNAVVYIDKIRKTLTAAKGKQELDDGWCDDMRKAPRDISEYSGHGPYILIKTIESSHDGLSKVEKIRTCYWDDSVDWWQIDTDGRYEYCGHRANPTHWMPLPEPPKKEENK